MNEIEKQLKFAGQLADAAREIVMPRFRKKIAVDSKGDDSPVTAADRECEKKMREMLADKYPQHSVYGEEFGGEIGGGFVWVLDPIDGTRSFISGSRQFCSLIALVQDGVPIAGVIDMPALNERWAGCVSPQMRRAFFNGAPCEVSAQTALQSAVMATTTLGVAEDLRDASLRRLCKRAGHVRLGGDASAFGSLASGFLDLAADYEMACYDYLPLVPIIRAAGGTITDWRGDNLQFRQGATEVIAAATDELHQAALSVLSEAVEEETAKFSESVEFGESEKLKAVTNPKKSGGEK